MAQNNYKIPENVLELARKRWGNCLRNPFDKVVEYMYKSNALVFEYQRRTVDREEYITDKVIEQPLPSVIKYLSTLKENSWLVIDDESIVLQYREEETDMEWAQRLHFNVFVSIDRVLTIAKDTMKELLKEREKLQRRLKEINNLL